MRPPNSQVTSAMFQVLLALHGGERHGYGIMREIAERTQGQERIGAATLYRTIKRLLEASFIEETVERPDPELDDERRRYYRVTGLGEQVARDEALRLAKLLESAYQKRLLERPGSGAVTSST